jgi:phage major head subunit gpT-like protein
MVPTTLQVEAQFILKAMFLAPQTFGAYSPSGTQVGAQDNMLRRFGVEPIVNKFLTSNTKWYMLDCTKAFRPFLWVVRESVKLVPRVNENDPNVFDSHMFQWGQWDRIAPGWSYPFLSAVSGPTGT